MNGCTYSRVTIEALYNLGHSMDYTLRFPALGKSMTEILQHLKLQEDGISPRCPVQKGRKKKKYDNKITKQTRKDINIDNNIWINTLNKFQVDLSCILLFPFFNFKKN